MNRTASCPPFVVINLLSAATLFIASCGTTGPIATAPSPSLADWASSAGASGEITVIAFTAAGVSGTFSLRLQPVLDSDATQLTLLTGGVFNVTF
jgi:hypothetical protein